jgi:hypothetical protein
MTQITDFDEKEFNAASLTGAYQALDTIVPDPCYEAIICNESDVPVYISTNGSDDMIRVGAGMIIPMTGLNRHTTITQGEYLFAAGTQLYIKHKGAPGTGIIVVNLLMTR